MRTPASICQQSIVEFLGEHQPNQVCGKDAALPDITPWTKAMDNTQFLHNCRKQIVSLEEMQTYLVQQYFYARNFTRFLCALVANMTNERDRFDLCQNLFEEMGLGDLGNIPHSKIYANMLSAMNIDPAQYQVFPETVALVETMQTLCSNPEPMVGLGAICLGAEAIVPPMYSQIVSGLKGLGYKESDYEFFSIHIDGDDDHAETMRRIIVRELIRDPGKAEAVTDAARIAIEARTRFFLALDREALIRHIDNHHNHTDFTNNGGIHGL